MKHLFVVLASIFGMACMNAAPRDTLLASLDKAINDRPRYVAVKEKRISELKRGLAHAVTDGQKLRLLDDLYGEYLTYSFDSTIRSLTMAEAIAGRTGRAEDMSRVKIHKALALATSGHFSEAVGLLRSVNSSSLSGQLLEDYYSAFEWTYGVWAEYSGDRDFASDYKSRSLVYLDSLLAVTVPGSPLMAYRKAEKALRMGEYGTAVNEYLSALSRIRPDTRLYAQAAYALAMAYNGRGDETGYREWLIKAAISDQMTPLKENLALQELSRLLKEKGGDLERANRYLSVSLEDAIFYNNRLRMLEIAEKFPEVAETYQATIESQNRRLKIFILITGLLLIGMAVTVGLLAVTVRKKRAAIDAKDSLTAELETLNARLRDTNSMRERYTSLFVDLCAAYIDKLNRFPMVLKLKVRHLSDLTSVADRYVRPSEGEMREMFFNFDTAFLRLYPDFIARFNALLRPDRQIFPKEKELLNTDLRIYALIRMGVTDSNRIASLLFLSPQTIFNHRTSVRNRAKDREAFERQVRDICAVLPS